MRRRNISILAISLSLRNIKKKKYQITYKRNKINKSWTCWYFLSDPHWLTLTAQLYTMTEWLGDIGTLLNTHLLTHWQTYKTETQADDTLTTHWLTTHWLQTDWPTAWRPTNDTLYTDFKLPDDQHKGTADPQTDTKWPTKDTLQTNGQTLCN